MNRIETFEQYKALTKEIKSKVSSVATNCYFMPNEAKQYIEQSKMYYEEFDGILCIYVVESRYNHLYYFRDKNVSIDIPSNNKTIVLDFVSRKEKEESLKEEEDCFVQAGFKNYKYYIRMKKDIVHCAEEIECKYEFSYGDESYSSQIGSLWENSLDALSTPLPVDDKIKDMINANKVFYMLDKGKVISAVYMDASGKYSLLEHISVDNNYRKQGLGEKMLKYALDRIRELYDAEICRLWVDVNNTPALNMYLKNGFIEEGLISKQYIK